MLGIEANEKCGKRVVQFVSNKNWHCKKSRNDIIAKKPKTRFIFTRPKIEVRPTKYAEAHQ